MKRWYLGSKNDGLFIIDEPPRPSNDDVWHDRSPGPTLVLNVVALSAGHAQEIVDAHNTALDAAEAIVAYENARGTT